MQETQASSIPFNTGKESTRTSRLQLFPVGSEPEPSKLRIHVLYTNFRGARAALEAAARMAADLDAEIKLIFPRIVPYPLPLDEPPVPLEFVSQEICRLADAADLNLRGHIYLCRNPLETLLREIRPGTLVVIGMRARWPFTKARRFARALKRNGCEVIAAYHS